MMMAIQSVDSKLSMEAREMSMKTGGLDYKLVQQIRTGLVGLEANLQHELEVRLGLGDVPDDLAEFLEVKE